VLIFDKKRSGGYYKNMNFYPLISSIVKYIFILTIYVFIFAIIRMIFKDIRNMVSKEEFVASQNNPVLRVLVKNDRDYTGARNDYPLDKMKNTIGRSAACDIMLEDMLVSNRHFCVWFEDGEWRIEDLNSRNGTILNGNVIHEPYLLDDGDRIRVGEMEFEFKV